MHDIIEEITGTLRRNKLRTAMTGFAVSVGIFLLIVLLGAGNGILHAFNNAMNGVAIDLTSVYGGVTNKPFAGFKEGRNIKIKENDAPITLQRLPHNVVMALPQQSHSVKYVFKKENVNGTMLGVYPQYSDINHLTIQKGRFINPIDYAQKRRMIVISNHLQELLFDKGHSAIGKTIVIDSLCYEVVGIYADKNFDSNTDTYIPYTTLQNIYNQGNELNTLQLKTTGLTTLDKSKQFETELRHVEASIHQFNPADENAIWINNNNEDIQTSSQATNILRKAIWVIGLLTMLSGVVGISNIMLITVRERTHEFGIRKALGAKPWSILRTVILESIVITSFFGYLGLVLGVAATEYLNYWSGNQTVSLGGQEITVFLDPTVDLSIAFEAVLVLIIAGMLAGLFPARKAVRVKPIEALRAE